MGEETCIVFENGLDNFDYIPDLEPEIYRDEHDAISEFIEAACNDN